MTYLSHFYPENFARDWYCNSALASGVFGYVTIGMGYLLSLASISWIGAFLCWWFISIGLYLTINSLYPENSLQAFGAAVFCIMTLGVPGLGGFHIGASSVWRSMYEPFFLASSIAVLGFSLFVYGKYLAAGIVIAVAMLLHPDILILGGIFLVVVFIVDTVTRSVATDDLMKLSIPILLTAFAGTTYVLLAHGPSEGMGIDIAAWQIAADFRAPHHCHVWEWFQWSRAEVRRYLGVIVLQSGAWVYSGPDRRGSNAFAVVIGSTAFLLLASTLLSVTFRWGFLGALQLAHVAPIISLMGMSLTGGAFAQLIFGKREVGPTRAIGSILVMLGGLILTLEAYPHFRPILAFPFFVIAFLLAFWDIPGKCSSRVGTVIRGGVSCAMALTLLGIATFGFLNSSIMKPKITGSDEIAPWITRNTDVQALFLVPPDLEDFRTKARRSIVVDFKAVAPPGLIQEWYSRISDISGTYKPRSMSEALQGYLRLNAHQIKKLKAKYGFDYVVVHSRKHQGDLTGMPLLYENDALRIYGTPT